MNRAGNDLKSLYFGYIPTFSVFLTHILTNSVKFSITVFFINCNKKRHPPKQMPAKG